MPSEAVSASADLAVVEDSVATLRSVTVWVLLLLLQLGLASFGFGCCHLFIWYEDYVHVCIYTSFSGKWECASYFKGVQAIVS